MARDVQSPKASGVSHLGSTRDEGFLATGRGTAHNREQRRQRVPPPQSDQSVRSGTYTATSAVRRDTCHSSAPKTLASIVTRAANQGDQSSDSPVERYTVATGSTGSE